MENREIEAVLNEIGQILELTGTNTFKVRAYQNAARSIASLQEDVSVLLAEKRFKVKGIGKSLAAKITELVDTGGLKYLDDIREGIPGGLFEVLQVPGVGPKKTRALWQDLGVVSLETLEAACNDGRVAELKGFGKKTQEKILDGIAHLALTRGRRIRSRVLPHAEAMRAYLQGIEGVERAEIGGSLRRGRETVKDADILVASKDAQPVMQATLDYPEVDGVIGSGGTKTSVRLRDGLQVDVRVVPPESFACGLAYFTGSKDFNIALRQLALEKGYSLNEYALRPMDGTKPPPLASEKELHRFLGLDYIHPHLRETSDGILAAAEKRLPKLVEPEEITGVLHVHTKWSDGTASVHDMVQQAALLGYAYIGISDHSQAAQYANGLSAERLERQREEVEAAREAFPDIRVLHGLEVDILQDGTLDMGEKVLESLDFVIAGVHMNLGMEREQMTKRLERALAHPTGRVFAHPEGRMLLKRDSSQFDWERVLDVAEENAVAIEVNGSPLRLDANWVRVRRIRARNIKLMINPDAHSMKALDNARANGIVEARRGWATRDDVINTLSLERFETEFLRS